MPITAEKYSKSWLQVQYKMSASSVQAMLNEIAHNWQKWAEKRPDKKELYESFELYNPLCRRITPKQLECLYYHIGKPD